MATEVSGVTPPLSEDGRISCGSEGLRISALGFGGFVGTGIDDCEGAEIFIRK